MIPTINHRGTTNTLSNGNGSSNNSSSSSNASSSGLDTSNWMIKAAYDLEGTSGSHVIGRFFTRQETFCVQPEQLFNERVTYTASSVS